MVMQVLVLAAQNAVDFRQIGVATSGSTLFRQIGGSIGVALFGTIFANRLHVELAATPAGGHRHSEDGQPGGDQAPATRARARRSRMRSPPPSIPVFIVACRGLAVRVSAAWLLRECRCEGTGEAIPPPPTSAPYRDSRVTRTALATVD